ncbi:MAG: 4Fe-4S binding protein [Chloroflexota bacterium]
MFGRRNGTVKNTVAAEPPPGLAQVAADASRCVQCGICGYNCPVGIEVREYARRGQNVTDNRCIACGACIEKCPRGTLRWGPAILVRPDRTLVVDPLALPLSPEAEMQGLGD